MKKLASFACLLSCLVLCLHGDSVLAGRHNESSRVERRANKSVSRRRLLFGAFLGALATVAASDGTATATSRHVRCQGPGCMLDCHPIVLGCITTGGVAGAAVGTIAAAGTSAAAGTAACEWDIVCDGDVHYIPAVVREANRRMMDDEGIRRMIDDEALRRMVERQASDE